VTKWCSRSTKLGREANERRDNGIAVVFMVVDSSCQRFVCVKPVISRSQQSCGFSIAKLTGARNVSEGCQIAANCS